MEWIIYKENKVIGCTFSDGADTREYSSKIKLVPKHKEDVYMECCADEYGSQDYSYRFSTEKIAELDSQQIMHISHTIVMALELSDVANYKKELKEIAEKLNQCFKDLEK